MKITLIIPPSPFLMDEKVFPFLGPLQIAAVARELNHDVNIIDLTGSKDTNIDINSDMVGFYSTAAQYPIVLQIYKSIKEKYPNIITVLGGPHANTSYNTINEFDYIVVSDQGGGGGESGFIYLLNNLSTNRIIKIPSRIGIEYENDRFPLPARDLIDLRSYYYYLNNERCTSIVSSSGCPFSCAYCCHWNGYRKVELKSAEKVKEEINYIKKTYSWNAIMFYDDEINLRSDFTSKFLPMLKNENIIWRAFFKNGKNLTDESIFKQMSEAGCVQICTGTESADNRILKIINKQSTIEDNTLFVKLAIKYNMRPKVFTQIGLPGENQNSIKLLRNWLVNMAQEGLQDADVSITTPYEGSPIFTNSNKYKLYKEELNYNKNAILYKGIPGQYKSYTWNDNLSQEDIVNARQWVEDEFKKAIFAKI